MKNTGMQNGQGFGKAQRKRNPTAMGGTDQVQFPNKPKMLAQAIRGSDSDDVESRVKKRNKDWLRNVQLEQMARRKK